MSIRCFAPLTLPMLRVLAATVPGARASAPLQVSAPVECPGARALERAVAAHVGRSVALDGVAVSIRRGPAGWHAQQLTDAGSRELEAESCEAALEAVALVLALAAAPDAASLPSREAPPDDVRWRLRL